MAELTPYELPDFGTPEAESLVGDKLRTFAVNALYGIMVTPEITTTRLRELNDLLGYTPLNGGTWRDPAGSIHTYTPSTMHYEKDKHLESLTAMVADSGLRLPHRAQLVETLVDVASRDIYTGDDIGVSLSVATEAPFSRYKAESIVLHDLRNRANFYKQTTYSNSPEVAHVSRLRTHLNKEWGHSKSTKLRTAAAAGAVVLVGAGLAAVNSR